MAKNKSTRTNPNIPIIFEDNHLLVIDKPANVLSQEDHTGDADVLSLCKEYIRVEYDKPGNIYLALIHRLDRPVSGLMVFAKTSKAASRLNAQMKGREIQKEYYAVVEGIIKEKDTLVHYLKKDEEKNFVHAFNQQKSNSKRAELSYERLGIVNKYSLVKIKLKTGRPHQIRVQFAKIGHALWGDVRYNKSESKNPNPIALRSSGLTIIHPTLKEKMEFHVKLPKNEPWQWFKNLV